MKVVYDELTELLGGTYDWPLSTEGKPQYNYAFLVCAGVRENNIRG
ncbi:MAG: hypothetical protein MZV64_27815 [Ignavibacteriales bacterium]|nr:hypothetical protein [Ignavibacteriales bacterium]